MEKDMRAAMIVEIAEQYTKMSEFRRGYFAGQMGLLKLEHLEAESKTKNNEKRHTG